MTPVTILIPDDLKPFLDQVAKGNIGDYLCRLLREAHAKARESRLEALLLEGLTSEAIPYDDDFRARLAERVEHILAQHE